MNNATYLTNKFVQSTIKSSIAIGVLGLAFSANADQVLLKNGDIISGEIVKKETDHLVIQTKYAGSVSINWSEVTDLKSDNPLKLVLDDGTRMSGFVNKSPEGKVNIVSDTKDLKTQYEMKDIKYVNPSKAVLGEGLIFSGNINAGAAFTSGNTDNKSANINGQMIARSKQNRYTLGGYYNWVENNGDETQRNTRVYAKYDHFFTNQWYGYVNTVFENDRYIDIKLRTAFGVGSGYQIYESPELNLGIEGGISYVNQDYYSGVEDENYAALRWALNYDQLFFDSRTQFFHNHQIFYGLESPAQTLIYTQTGLRFPFLANLNATAQVNYNYDSLPAAGRKKGDTRSIFTLGYAW